MTQSAILQALMDVPEPAADGKDTIALGSSWTVPIFDPEHCRAAFAHWPRYSFQSAGVRRTAAGILAGRAARLGIIPDALRVLGMFRPPAA